METQVKGVVLAGGTGSRLLPLTEVTNKHTLPVGKEPMVFHPVRKLVQAGITDIMVVTGGEHPGDLLRLLGNGSRLGCRLTYAYQEGSGGIADALRCAENFCGDGYVTVILGDNVFEDDLTTMVKLYDRCGGALVGLKLLLTSDAKRFGVVTNSVRLSWLPKVRCVTSIIEKPADPPTDLAVVGIYMYDSSVWRRISVLKPSARNELEVTDLNNLYARDGKLFGYELVGEWTDAGTFESLYKANQIALGRTGLDPRISHWHPSSKHPHEHADPH